jgi:hypothetical protein
MEAILAGMVEGVIVVDPQARLQLVNDARTQMLQLETVTIGGRTSRRFGCRRSPSSSRAVLRDDRRSALQLSPPRDPSRTIMASAAPAAGRPRTA